MDNVLKDYIGKCCFVYMNDVVIFFKSLRDHLIHIENIFSKFREYNLKIQMDKSEFVRKEINFLDHVVTPKGIKPNLNKIRAVLNYPLPSN